MNLDHFEFIPKNSDHNFFHSAKIYQHRQNPSQQVFISTISVQTASLLNQHAQTMTNRMKITTEKLNSFFSIEHEREKNIIYLLHNFPGQNSFNLNKFMYRNLEEACRFFHDTISSLALLEELGEDYFESINLISVRNQKSKSYTLIDFFDINGKFCFFNEQLFSDEMNNQSENKPTSILRHLSAFTLLCYFNFSQNDALEFCKNPEFYNCQVKCALTSQLEESVECWEEETFVTFLLELCRFDEKSTAIKFVEINNLFISNVWEKMSHLFQEKVNSQKDILERSFQTHSFSNLVNVSPSIEHNMIVKSQDSQKNIQNTKFQKYQNLTNNENRFKKNPPQTYDFDENSETEDPLAQKFDNTLQNIENDDHMNLFASSLKDSRTINKKDDFTPGLNQNWSSPDSFQIIKDDNKVPLLNNRFSDNSQDFLKFTNDAIDYDEFKFDVPKSTSQNIEIDFLKSQNENPHKQKKRNVRMSNELFGQTNLIDEFPIKRNKTGSFDNLDEKIENMSVNKPSFSTVEIPLSGGNSRRVNRIDFKNNLTLIKGMKNNTDIFMIIDPDNYTPTASAISRNFEDDFGFIDEEKQNFFPMNFENNKEIFDKKIENELISCENNFDFVKNERFKSEYLLENLEIATKKTDLSIVAKKNLKNMTNRILKNEKKVMKVQICEKLENEKKKVLEKKIQEKIVKKFIDQILNTNVNKFQSEFNEIANKNKKYLLRNQSELFLQKIFVNKKIIEKNTFLQNLKLESKNFSIIFQAWKNRRKINLNSWNGDANDIIDKSSFQSKTLERKNSSSIKQKVASEGTFNEFLNNSLNITKTSFLDRNDQIIKEIVNSSGKSFIEKISSENVRSKNTSIYNRPVGNEIFNNATLLSRNINNTSPQVVLPISISKGKNSFSKITEHDQRLIEAQQSAFPKKGEELKINAKNNQNLHKISSEKMDTSFQNKNEVKVFRRVQSPNIDVFENQQQHSFMNDNFPVRYIRVNQITHSVDISKPNTFGRKDQNTGHLPNKPSIEKASVRPPSMIFVNANISKDYKNISIGQNKTSNNFNPSNIFTDAFEDSHEKESMTSAKRPSCTFQNFDSERSLSHNLAFPRNSTNHVQAQSFQVNRERVVSYHQPLVLDEYNLKESYIQVHPTILPSFNKSSTNSGILGNIKK